MAKSFFAVVLGIAGATVGDDHPAVERTKAAVAALNDARPTISELSPTARGVGITPGAAGRPSAIAGPDLPVAIDVDPSGRVSADAAGLARCCWGRDGEVVVVSDSSSVVARAIGATLDPLAVGTLSLVGFLLGDATLYHGVHRLPGGTGLDVTGPAPRLFDVPAPSRTVDVDADGDGAGLMRTVVGGLLSVHPDPVLELSGGLDSRAIVAALSTAGRTGLRAVTLGRPADPDVRVGERVAREAGLRWTVIDTGGVWRRPADELMRETMQAAARRDHVVDALSAVVLDHAETLIPPGPRFTGLNGEFARGFYYPGFLTDGRVDRGRVRRLASWRLFTNDGTAAAALDPDLAAAAREAVVTRVVGLLGEGSAWRAATDEFYLSARVGNWAGPGYTARDDDSPALAPFLHPDFLAWARALPTRRRAREQAFARMVGMLDPNLAAVPLDRGPSVADLATGGLRGATREVTSTTTKLAAKLRQRVQRRAAPAPVAADLAHTLQGGWTTEQSGALAATGLFRPEFLDRLASRRPVDGPSLSLAVNVAGAVGVVDEAAKARRQEDELRGA